MNSDKHPSQEDGSQGKDRTNKHDTFNNDIIKISNALDSIAKLIIARRKQTETINKDIETEYNNRLRHLNTLINLILKLNENDQSNINTIVDTTKLDALLKDKIDIIEKDGQSFALIPVKNEYTTGNNVYDDTLVDENKLKKKTRKKKKNKIPCSFCNQPGHTRAHCDKRLYNIH